MLCSLKYQFPMHSLVASLDRSAAPYVGAVGFVICSVSSPAAGHVLVCMTLTTGRRMRKKTQPVMMPAMASMPKKRSLVMTE
jgi:hypothetical protein